jgi:DNA-directed RNA polymerase sigma subunit (sigma70/sigma32)
MEELKNNADLSKEERNVLLTQKNQGTRSQEVLIISALPLIKNITSREFQRRKAWNSRVSFDDLLQEAISGFIRGLLSYDETSNHGSPTNYLGQWITTTIRRRTENLEHDFAIPYEVVERSRRIKAVAGRLNTELNRPPTDEELLEALNDPNDTNKGAYKWGGTKASGDKKPVRAANKFTMAHIQEAKDLNDRSYSLYSSDTSASEDDQETYEKASTSLTADEASQYSYEDADLSSSRLQFFEQAFITMRIGSRQRDIILRCFGLKPYIEPQTQKEIIAQTALPPRFVKSVITSFQVYMPHKGGVFHRIILDMEPDDVEALELTWLIPILGDWPKGKRTPDSPPAILTQTTLKTTQKSLEF